MYLFILKSEAEGGFYVGNNNDPWAKLSEINSNESVETYTGKHKPWIMMSVFKINDGRLSAKQIVTFIKRHQEFNLIEKMIDPGFIPSDKLVQLERVSTDQP